MTKSDAEVIKQFGEVVNMTVPELKKWLATSESKGAGWTGGNEGGETVGHDSGNRIVDILERNPDKKADKYTEEDIKHMRKVVAYCSRHLAQEGHMKETKSKAELAKTKSTKSLKNWGHDPLKGMSSSKGGKKNDKEEEPDEEEAPEEEEEAEDGADEGDDDDEADADDSDAKTVPQKRAKGDADDGEVDEEEAEQEQVADESDEDAEEEGAEEDGDAEPAAKKAKK